VLPSLGLVLAAVVAAVLVTGAAALRLAVEVPGAPVPDRLVPTLIAAAVFLVGLLAIPRLPGLAWGAIALGAPIAAVEIVTVVRSLETAAGAAWRELTLIAGLALVGAVVVGAGYAARNPSGSGPSTMARAATAIVGLAVLASIAVTAWAVLAPGGPTQAAVGELSPLRIAIRIALVTTAAAFAIGAARAIGPAAARAAHRARQDARSGDGGLWRSLGLLADELLPARSDTRRAAVEEERARLAADLHAHVLPELRRAAAMAASAGAPPEMQGDLRRALEDVEQLMHRRQSIVLEQFGLVAALEWLAERTEERSPLRVELELNGAAPDGPGTIEPRAARAAFRIALLGLDNVVRHAGASTATLRLDVGRDELRLAVADDGPPASLEGSRGRGLSDMQTAAAESGGTLRIVGDSGARVEAVWPAGRPGVSRTTGTLPSGRPGS
jgi:signal transduction histidine kinase